MINNDRIVPITAVSLLDMYAVILNQVAILNSGTLAKLDAAEPGEFEIETAGLYICDEPVKHVEIADSTDCAFYFIPAYDFKGIAINEVEQDLSSFDIQPDGRTLYMAEVSSGTLSVADLTL